jgi:hypothetical protein
MSAWNQGRGDAFAFARLPAVVARRKERDAGGVSGGLSEKWLPEATTLRTSLSSKYMTVG